LEKRRNLNLEILSGGWIDNCEECFPQRKFRIKFQTLQFPKKTVKGPQQCHQPWWHSDQQSCGGSPNDMSNTADSDSQGGGGGCGGGGPWNNHHHGGGGMADPSANPFAAAAAAAAYGIVCIVLSCLSACGIIGVWNEFVSN